MTDTLTCSWYSAALTHVGHVRQINEDAYLDSPKAGMWAVADGMGGHHAGDVASTSIIRALRDVKPANRLSQYVNDIEDRLIGVNTRLRQMAAEHNDNRTIGSTIIALVALGNHCALMWAGDSRAYRFRDNKVLQITRDHSQVEEMVERGLLQPEDAESHPASNVITRAVGAADVLYVDVDLHELQKDDVFLLCSDGLYKHISKDEIEDLLKSDKSVQECARYLIDNTLERGASDNVTVVLVKIS
ncbi:MAG: PP2C family serine/threonine-protein phosphatase [Thiohalomonadales bacterium]